MDMATCSTCGNRYDPDDVKGTHPYRHPVNGPFKSAKSESTEQSMKASIDQLPTDPVLRLVLIRKGVLSPLDLTEAEQELAATGMAGARAQEGYREGKANDQYWQERVGEWPARETADDTV